MIQKCKSCQQEYNILNQSSLCPHKQHPKMCTEHNRTLCGMPECNEQREENDNNSRMSTNPNSNNNSQLSYGG